MHFSQVWCVGQIALSAGQIKLCESGYIEVTYVLFTRELTAPSYIIDLFPGKITVVVMCKMAKSRQVQ